MKKSTKAAIVLLLLTALLLPANVFALDTYEPNDSFLTAQPFSSISMISYISSAGDADYYKLTGSKMIYTYVASPSGKTYDVYLYDKDFNLIGSTLTPDLGTVIVKATTAGETYYLKVVSRDGSYDASNSYRLTVYFKFPFI